MIQSDFHQLHQVSASILQFEGINRGLSILINHSIVFRLQPALVAAPKVVPLVLGLESA